MQTAWLLWQARHKEDDGKDRCLFFSSWDDHKIVCEQGYDDNTNTGIPPFFAVMINEILFHYGISPKVLEKGWAELKKKVCGKRE